MIFRKDLAGRRFQIRQAGHEDAPALAEILSELALSDDYILLSPEEVEIDSARRGEEIARARSMSDRWHLAVADQDGVAVGMLDLRAIPMRKCGHVMELGIGLRAGARGRGIGTAMMRYAVETAASLGYRKLRLFVIAGNDRALHLYSKEGFSETGRFVGEVRVRDRFEDLVVMERMLP